MAINHGAKSVTLAFLPKLKVIINGKTAPKTDETAPRRYISLRLKELFCVASNLKCEICPIGYYQDAEGSEYNPLRMQVVPSWEIYANCWSQPLREMRERYISSRVLEAGGQSLIALASHMSTKVKRIILATVTAAL